MEYVFYVVTGYSLYYKLGVYMEIIENNNGM